MTAATAPTALLQRLLGCVFGQGEVKLGAARVAIAWPGPRGQQDPARPAGRCGRAMLRTEGARLRRFLADHRDSRVKQGRQTLCSDSLAAAKSNRQLQNISIT
jgi:hypothetical protein